jgi:hypothetical protein
VDVIGIACPVDLLFSKSNPAIDRALVRTGISARLASFLAVSGVGGRWCRWFGVGGILGHHIHRIPVVTI